MNRNVVVTIGVLVIIIVAVGGYMFMNRSSVNPSAIQTENPSVSPVATTITTEKTSLKDFMRMTGDQKCEFKDEDSSSSGNIYLNSGKMRGDFISSVNDKESITHMINNGTDIFIWIDGQKTGFKTTLDSIEQISKTEGTTRVSQPVDINKQSLAMLAKQVDYKCEAWTVEQLKFAVPDDVNFQDIAAMMKKIPASATGSGMSNSNIEACSACNNLETDAQAQCKRALKCN